MIAAVISIAVFIMCSADTMAESSGSAVTMPYESTLFDTSQIIEINVEIDEAQWADLLGNATSEQYYACDVTVNGRSYKNVGIRAKGNTSLSMVASSDSDRYSFKVKFDEYVDNQTADGLSKLILNNNYADATLMKEAVIYDMFAYLGADASLYNYAKVSVNGEYWGIYLALEAVEEEFALRNYGSSYGQLYKPDSLEMGGAGKMKNFDIDEIKEMMGLGEDAQTSEGMQMHAKNQGGKSTDRPDMEGVQGRGDKASGGFGGGFSGFGGSGSTTLNYIDENLSSYKTIWESSVLGSTDTDHRRVVTALKNLCLGDGTTETLEQYMDVDNMLKYMAVHTFSVNLDSLSGNMAHNYYLYEEDGRLNMIPWDYNLAFGGFQSGDASDTVNFPIDTPFSSSIDMNEDRQLFAALLNNEECLAKYHEYLRILSEEYLGGGQFEATYERIRSQIDQLAADDPTAFYDYEEFDAAAEMLVKTVTLRAESILGQLDGTIPSTHQGQSAKPDALVDCTGIDISMMGSQMGGVRGDRDGNKNSGRFQPPEDMQMPDFGNMPEGMQMPDFGNIPEDMQMPDFSNMPEGMQMPDFGQMPHMPDSASQN